VIVSDGDTANVDRGTLVHELVHALQDQQFGLDRWPETRDGQMARNGLVEGEASLVPELYRDRCETEWSCLRSPDASGSSDGIDRGLFSVVIYPYDVGPSFVDHLRADGGWAAVDDAHGDQPTTTEQITHPSEYPADMAEPVSVPDRSGEAWSRLDHDPVGERLGEAAVFVMFQTNGVIEPERPGAYDHPASAGWGGDRLVPYRRDDGAYGYVWNLTWESPADAREFHDRYLELLDRHGSVSRGDDRYLLADGPFADAFRVVRDGRVVRIVNAPSVDALSGVHGAGS